MVILRDMNLHAIVNGPLKKLKISSALGIVRNMNNFIAIRSDKGI